MKGFVTLLVLMLVAVLSLPGSMAFPLSPQSRLSRHIITVGDEPGDGNYTSIKEALNHSSPGDIIEVYSGTYKEHGISITVEGISLIGLPYDPDNPNQTGKPLILGQGLSDIITIYGPNVTVSGFHIDNKGGGIDEWTIININPGADYCTISNNTLTSSSNSIVGIVSSYNTITNNTIRWAGFITGIELDYPGQHNVVSDNVIDRCPDGIRFWGGINDTIVRNRISNCSQFGVDIGGGGANVFQYNTFENNNIGLHIYQSAYNQVRNNNFLNNSYHAGFDEALWVCTNRWFHNYWGRPRLLPYPIQGSNLLIFSWVQFDWRPAMKPYDIT